MLKTAEENLVDRLRVGMRSDQAANIVRQSGVKATRHPKGMGEDDNGLIIEWYIAGVVITLKRQNRKAGNCYWITQISHEKEDG